MCLYTDETAELPDSFFVFIFCCKLFDPFIKTFELIT
jgi:hypothetical protein